MGIPVKPELLGKIAVYPRSPDMIINRFGKVLHVQSLKLGSVQSLVVYGESSLMFAGSSEIMQKCVWQMQGAPSKVVSKK